MPAKRNHTAILGRVTLTGLTIWALLMIVPDLYRVVRPLGSFGLLVTTRAWSTTPAAHFRKKPRRRLGGPGSGSAIASISRKCAASRSTLRPAQPFWR